MADEYIRKQDAVDVFNRAVKDVGILDADDIETVFGMLSSADVVPVVRCQDCENWQTDWNPSIPDRHYCAVIDSMMKAEDFCSYGKRREG